MGLVEVEDQRSPVAVPAAIAGVVTLCLLAVLNVNMLGVLTAPIAVVILIVGKTVERQGADRTVVKKQRTRTPQALWTATGLFVVAVLGSMLQGPAFVTLVLVVAAGTTGFMAYSRGGGTFPWSGMNDEPAREMTPEDRAARMVGDRLFHETGIFVKSAATGLPVYPEILRVAADDKGRVYFDCRVISGYQTVDDVRNKAGNLASAWNVPRVVVSEPAAHVARCTAIIHETRITGAVEWSPRDVSMPVSEYVRSLPMGADVAEGDLWRLDLAERNFVIAGQPGSGKSSFANALLAHLGRHRDVRLAFIDLKFGAEAAPWGPRADTIVRNRPRDDDAGVEEAIDFINAATDEVGDRYERMIERGITNAWSEGFLGPDEPVKVLVIDECSNLFRSDTKEAAKRADRALAALQAYVEQGRAAGYVLVISTQYPTTDNLPTRIRNNVSDRIAFRSSDQGMSATLGQSYVPSSDAVDPTRISKADAGQAVIVGDDGEARRIQMAWLDNEKKKMIVASCASLKHESWLDKVPAPRAVQEPQTERKRSPQSDEDAVQAEMDDLLKDLDLD